MARDLIVGRRIVDEMVKNGILENPDTITRVTIDIPANELPRIYVERVGDKRLLSIVPAISDAGLEIDRVDAEDDEMPPRVAPSYEVPEGMVDVTCYGDTEPRFIPGGLAPGIKEGG